MPRKAFLADVAAAAAASKSISQVIDVKRGGDDGDIDFQFVPASGGEPIHIGLLAMDVSGYPEENTFMIFTKSSDIPAGVNDTLDEIANFSAGMSVSELIGTISERLRSHLATGTKAYPLTIDSDVEMVDQADREEEDDSEEEYDGEFSDEDEDDGFGPFSSQGKRASASYTLSPEVAAKLNKRIRHDLRVVKFSGFKIGILQGLHAESHTSIASISIQAAKLGLSEEALQAWDLEPSQYIVLLIRYSAGYKPYENIIAEPAKALEISFRIGVSRNYKPTLVQALAAFTEMSKDGSKTHNEEDAMLSTEDADKAGFSSIFISSSLNEFINEQFVSLLKVRSNMGLSWDGAKHFYNARLGKPDERSGALPAHYYEESVPKQSSLPDIINSDHLMENTKEISFPLIAAQFAMRYFLRCTEFCLVCHDRIEGAFEALKPYVCDKPLCLYQYMSLGFGPSVEHEILTQPYVVDLLVSFCYVAAFCQRIREYPTGMSLSVPAVLRSVTANTPLGLDAYTYDQPASAAVRAPTIIPENMIEVKFDSSLNEVIFEAGSCPVRNGEWVVVCQLGKREAHYRIEDTSLFPTVKLSDNAVDSHPTTTAPLDTPTPSTTPPPSARVAAKLVIYDQNFDDMDKSSKSETIVTLLHTLPSIQEMRSYLLQKSKFSEPSLRTWKERISPAALGLLRWIIASNRSCIVQVDKCPGQGDADVTGIRLDQKCANVDSGWVQFRFAQGSPDKEQRFLNALKAQKSKLSPKYPTMFAFHGSPIQNWHSIIRHGLDFAETLHGRAYGHGVYHALDQSISLAYAHGGKSIAWPRSGLKITQAMSVNEIVNSPADFASSSPYVVVQHVDWIQCRYLLVQTNENQSYTLSTKDSGSATVAVDEVEQDPRFTAKTTMLKPIGIPQCAISVSRSFRASKVKSGGSSDTKRQKGSSGGKDALMETAISDEDELEDLTFLFSDDEVPNGNNKDKGKGKDKELVKKKTAWFELVSGSTRSKKENTRPLTDFIPGSLDQDSLPIMQEPKYATPSATMRLQRELKTALKVQESTPSHELGWYINPELISNVYQWIVELHSFESTLPLAQDMKMAGMASIVLEIRFGKDYPMSPPFVRVIRPRFLPFTLGGGGHVTGGGAMCMELLTNSGWSAVSSIESVLLQVRLAVQNLEPKPARLLSTNPAKHQQMDYGTGEAMDAYRRACMTHGWEIPKDFNEFAATGGSPGSSRLVR